MPDRTHWVRPSNKHHGVEATGEQPVSQAGVESSSLSDAIVMKLLNCLDCHDIVKLPPNGTRRACMCGKSSAQYKGDHNVVVRGNARSLSINSREYYESLNPREEGKTFAWWETNSGVVEKR